MIKCPKCKAITITRTPSYFYVCHKCGINWKSKECNNEKRICKPSKALFKWVYD